MIIASHKFWQENHGFFNPFDEAHIFGSALEKECPQDIDLVLIYSGGFSTELRQARDAIIESVFQQFCIEAHLTILSVSENIETQFLEMVRSIQIYPLQSSS